MNTLWIETLSLSHYRNYDTLRLDLSPEPVVLSGKNGAGKTNLLEAVSFLAPGRGLRRASLSEVQKQGDGAAWTVAAHLHSLNGPLHIGTGRDPESGTSEKRLVRIDGKASRGQAELGKLFPTLWLTPQMDSLFLESDSERRKFLDRLVYAFDPEHGTRVNSYEFAMRERNRLLQMPSPDGVWLTTLEKEMAEFGVAMVNARLEMVENLNRSIQASSFSFPKARMELQGFVEQELQAGTASLEIEEKARQKLSDNRRVDSAAGRVTFGLHRSIMHTWFDSKNMKAEYCSTGEQKALLLSIILAQAQAVKEWKGTAPVLLLDEVVSHLDVSRRAELCEAILTLGSQCWLTGTDSSFFSGLENRSQRLAVENGKVKKID